MDNLLQEVEWSNQQFVGPGLQVYGLARPLKSQRTGISSCCKVQADDHHYRQLTYLLTARLV